MALSALETVIGAHVLDSPEILEEYSGDLSFVHPIRPRCVAKPKSTVEVQALVKWANETCVPLVPVSSGAPHFRGDTVPGAGGAVIVDLSGMKQIIRIDRKNRVAMVEPGVTFSELVPALAQEGLRLNMPLLPRSSKSVIGSMLEREPVIMPLYQWDVMDPLACIEVIFGTGDLFRTGAAAGPGTLEEQWAAGQAQVNPMGPGQTDFARVVQGAQGTMGIVTWASVRCEALPSLQEPFLMGSDRFGKLAEFIYRLLRLKFGDECLLLNKTEAATILAKNHEEYTAIKDSLPRWLLFFCLSGFQYFPEEKWAYQKKDMLEAAKQFHVRPVKAISQVLAGELLKTLQKPSEEPYWKLRFKGAREDVFFLTTLDRVPGFVEVMYAAAEQRGYPTSDISIYVQPMVQGTSCHCEFGLPYDPTNKKEATLVRELHAHASEALMNAGAFFSRPYGALASMVYRRDGETAAALRKTKSIFDPNNIMNAGKLCF
jgi:FAD/FMN-containing dehydrogenase